MLRKCDSCGIAFNTSRASARFCTDRCRQRGKRAPKPPTTRDIPVELPEDVSDLLEVTKRDLAVAGRLDSILGQQAVALAARMSSRHETGAALASLSRELRAVMVEALAGAERATTWVDEMAARRARRAAG